MHWSHTPTFSDLILPRPQATTPALARDGLLMLGGSLLVALLAHLTIPLPLVPITGQTLGVLLAGAALGWRRGGLAMLAYLAEGGVGLPVFAGGTGGMVHLLGPTGGYLVSYVLAAALIGFLAEHGWDRRSWSTALAMLLGNLVIYAVGLPWLGVVAHLSPQHTFQFGLYPFIIGDTIKLVLAAALLPGAWYLVTRVKAANLPQDKQEGVK